MSEIISRDEAVAQGRKSYFTGVPCIHGHVAMRAVTNQRCYACMRAYSGNNKEKVKQGQANWRAENKGRCRENGLRYRKANRDKYTSPEWRAHRRKMAALRREANRADHNRKQREIRKVRAEHYRAKDREYRRRRYARDPAKARAKAAVYWADSARRAKKRAAQRASYAKHAKLQIAKARERRHANPDKAREQKLAWQRNRRARKRASDGRHSAIDVQRLFVAQRGKCAYCRARLIRPYHVDHIQPLAKGGSNDPTNLQLTCQSCNCRKWMLDPIEFAQRNGLLL